MSIAMASNAVAARKSLERHWCKLGLKRLAGKELFLLDLAMQRPTYADLLRGDK